MDTYRTFKRSARNFEEFSSAEKIEVETGLTYSEAREQCEDFNNIRSDEEIAAGTKMEFEVE
jgi:hypothetical protein